MRGYKLRSNVVIREPAGSWIEPDREYEGDWVPGHPRHPGRIRLVHPRRSDVLFDISERDVEAID